MKVIINKEEMQLAVIAFFGLPTNSEVCLEESYVENLQQSSKQYETDHVQVNEPVSEAVCDVVEEPEKVQVVKQPIRRRRRTAKKVEEPVAVVEPTPEPVVETEVQEVKTEVVEEVKQPEPVTESLSSRLFNKNRNLVEVKDTDTSEVNVAKTFFTANPTEQESVETEWNHPWLSKPEPKEELKPMTAEDLRIARENSPFKEWHKPEDEPFQMSWVKERLANEAKAKATEVAPQDCPSFMPKEWS